VFILTQCGKEHRRHNNILITVELWTFPVSAIIQNFNFSFKVKTQLFYTLNLYYLTLSVLRVTRPKRGQKTLLCSLKGQFAHVHTEKYCVQSHAIGRSERPFALCQLKSSMSNHTPMKLSSDQFQCWYEDLVSPKPLFQHKIEVAMEKDRKSQNVFGKV